MTNENKENTVSDVLGAIKLSSKLSGYYSIHSMLSRIWIDNDDDWTKYEKYVLIIASDKKREKARVVSEMQRCIGHMWRRGNGDYNTLKCLFGYSPDSSNQPTWILFMRTVLSVLFYCDENNVDAVSLITGLDNSNFSEDDKYNECLAGYTIILLRNIGLPDTTIDKATMLLDDTIKNNSHREAFITYIKHKSIFFAAVEFDGIVIPPECYNLHIGELFEDDYDSTAARTVNYLLRNGIRYLKDFRYYSSDDVKGFRNFGPHSYIRLIEALGKLVTSQAL